MEKVLITISNQPTISLEELFISYQEDATIEEYDCGESQ